ncbi:MAG: hypothetical protein WAO90_13785 [Mycobacterium sp.]
MAGDASLIKVRESGDVFIWDNSTTYVPGTSAPTDSSVALATGWKAAGLMLGDPGVGITRSIERTDVNSWQQGRVLERLNNPKVDLNFTLLEDNPTVLELVGQDSVPTVSKRYLLLEFLLEDGKKERWVSKAEARLFVSSDDLGQDVKGREISASLVPVAGKYWTILPPK